MAQSLGFELKFTQLTRTSNWFKYSTSTTALSPALLAGPQKCRIPGQLRKIDNKASLLQLNLNSLSSLKQQKH